MWRFSQSGTIPSICLARYQHWDSKGDFRNQLVDSTVPLGTIVQRHLLVPRVLMPPHPTTSLVLHYVDRRKEGLKMWCEAWALTLRCPLQDRMRCTSSTSPWKREKRVI